MIGVFVACRKQEEILKVYTLLREAVSDTGTTTASLTLSQFLTILPSPPRLSFSSFFFFSSFSKNTSNILFPLPSSSFAARYPLPLSFLSALSCSSFSPPSDCCALYFHTPPVKTHSLNHFVFLSSFSQPLSLAVCCSLALLLLPQHEKMPLLLCP